MPADCSGCKSSLKRYDDSLTCSGCSRLFHIGCVNVSVSQYDSLRREKNWLCPFCHDAAPDASAGGVDPPAAPPVGIESVLLRLEQVEANFSAQIAELKSVIVCLQSQLQIQSDGNSNLLKELQLARTSNAALAGQLARSSGAGSPHPPEATASSDRPGSYSRAVSQRSSVVVKPKDSHQANSITKMDLLKTVDPVTNDVDVVAVKHIANGGIIVSCSTDRDAAKLRQVVGSKLSEKYDIKDISKIHPRIRICGLTENHDSDSLINFLRVQNSDIFGSGKTTFISSSRLKNNKNIFQAIFQVDPGTYHSALKCGKVFVGYDSCRVYDALEVVRCFNCCGYHHVSSNCKSKSICPRCAGDHKVGDCNSQSLKCANCFGLKKLDPNIDVNHAAWDRECPVYKRKLSSLRADVAGPA